MGISVKSCTYMKKLNKVDLWDIQITGQIDPTVTKIMVATSESDKYCTKNINHN